MNFFRGGAALCVCVAHAYHLFFIPISGRNTISKLATLISGLSVLVFFVLSGYLIAHTSQQNIRNNGFFDWKNYGIKRVLRIYPPLILSVFVVVTIGIVIDTLDLHGKSSYILPTDITEPIRTIYAYSFSEIRDTLFQLYGFFWGGYLIVNGPLWSLGLEVGFYLLWGLIATIFFPSPDRRFISKVCASIGVIIFLYVSIKHRPHFYFFLFQWLLGFIVFFALPTANLRIVKIVGLLIGVLLFALAFTYPTLLSFDLSANGMIGQILMGVEVACLIHISLHSIKFPQINLIDGGAKYAYTLYVCHFPILLLGFSLLHRFSTTLYVYLPLVSGWVLVTIAICKYMAIVVENRLLFEQFLNKAYNFATRKLPPHG